MHFSAEESGVPGDALKAQKHMAETGRSDFCLSYERVRLSSHFFLRFLYFMYMIVLPACMYVGHVLVWFCGDQKKF